MTQHTKYVHHITPGRADLNFGKAINHVIEFLPDDDWVCLRDIDTLPLHHRVFFKQCEDIANSGEWDLVSCKTNIIYFSILQNLLKGQSVQHIPFI